MLCSMCILEPKVKAAMKATRSHSVLFNNIHSVSISHVAVLRRTHQVQATAGFPLGLENLGKSEGIFQSGKSQGILNRLEKLGKSQGILSVRKSGNPALPLNCDSHHSKAHTSLVFHYIKDVSNQS